MCKCGHLQKRHYEDEGECAMWGCECEHYEEKTQRDAPE